MKRTSIGKRRTRIVLQKCEVNTNDIGDPVETWVEFARVWAAVDVRQGKEQVQAGQETASLIYRVNIRYIDGVKPDMRVVLAGKVLNIREIINLEERYAELQILCEDEKVV